MDRDGGETLGLLDPTGCVVDAVQLPAQTQDHSFGRSPDGAGAWRYLLTPTPISPNVTAAFDEPIRVAIDFSPEPGKYPRDFNLSVTAEPVRLRIPFEL